MLFQKREKEPLTFRRLLGIIVVLVVLGLISVFVVSKLGNNDGKKDFENDIKNLLPLIGNYVDTKNYQKPVTFVFSANNVIPQLEVEMEVPIGGSITVLENGDYIINKISNGIYCISEAKEFNSLKAKKIDTCEDLSSMIPVIPDSDIDLDNVDNGGGSKQSEKSDLPPEPTG